MHNRQKQYLIMNILKLGQDYYQWKYTWFIHHLEYAAGHGRLEINFCHWKFQSPYLFSHSAIQLFFLAIQEFHIQKLDDFISHSNFPILFLSLHRVSLTDTEHPCYITNWENQLHKWLGSVINISQGT